MWSTRYCGFIFEVVIAVRGCRPSKCLNSSSASDILSCCLLLLFITDGCWYAWELHVVVVIVNCYKISAVGKRAEPPAKYDLRIATGLRPQSTTLNLGGSCPLNAFSTSIFAEADSAMDFILRPFQDIWIVWQIAECLKLWKKWQKSHIYDFPLTISYQRRLPLWTTYPENANVGETGLHKILGIFVFWQCQARLSYNCYLIRWHVAVVCGGAGFQL